MTDSIKLTALASVLSRKTPLFVTVAIVLLSYGTIAHLQLSRLSEIDRKADRPLTKAEYLREEQQTQASLKLLAKLPTFGFDNLIANWSFLNFLQYFGDDQARPKTGYRITPDFFQVVVDRDPRFLAMYPYLSASVSLYGGKPQETVRLLQQGINAIPPAMQSEAYFLWQAKATDELLFLGKTQDARRSYEMAASWASQSKDPQMQAIAARSLQTAQFLATNPDSRRARVGSWYNILTNAIDQPTREFAAKQIQALGGEIVNRNGAFQVKLPQTD
ncbi:hypothetical protein [Altericista sp. CCNU0014]|uniref:hypothetical protein n=1 Tax=Altericista sp. CCNU0014 TaxID=3082949 RepID=UPI00384E8216